MIKNSLLHTMGLYGGNEYNYNGSNQKPLSLSFIPIAENRLLMVKIISETVYRELKK
jgi:hypothetical protein